jgi:xanthosine utilization system XapX-like protein
LSLYCLLSAREVVAVGLEGVGSWGSDSALSSLRKRLRREVISDRCMYGVELAMAGLRIGIEWLSLCVEGPDAVVVALLNIQGMEVAQQTIQALAKDRDHRSVRRSETVNENVDVEIVTSGSTLRAASWLNFQSSLLEQVHSRALD